MIEPDTLSPGDLPDGHPQRAFESVVRLRSYSPFSAVMDFAVAMFLEDVAAQDDESDAKEPDPDVAIDLQIVVLLGLALYQAGLDQHAVAEGLSRVEFQPHHIDMLPAAALLADADRARELLTLRPGHPSYEDGRMRSSCALEVVAEGQGGHGEQWETLLQRTRELLDRTISARKLSLPSGTVRAKLDALLSAAHTWNTFDWYDSDRFPAIDRPSS